MCIKPVSQEEKALRNVYFKLKLGADFGLSVTVFRSRSYVAQIYTSIDTPSNATCYLLLH